MIKTANQQPGVRRQGGYRHFVAHTLLRRLVQRPINWKTRGQVQAAIVRSNWIVMCPFCAGAQVIEPGEPFCCVDCVMSGNEGYSMDVVYPEERAEIERILMLRPNPLNRNWLPHETIADLIAENLEHGIEV